MNHGKRILLHIGIIGAMLDTGYHAALSIDCTSFDFELRYCHRHAYLILVQVACKLKLETLNALGNAVVGTYSHHLSPIPVLTS